MALDLEKNTDEINDIEQEKSEEIYNTEVTSEIEENLEEQNQNSEEEALSETANPGMSKRKNMALIRLTIAGAIAVLIMCLTGFGGIKILAGGSEAKANNIAEGKYLTFNIDTILDYVAEEYKTDSDTLVGRYALVPMDGKMVIVHLPQRYLSSADAIVMQTYYVMYGYTTADSYFVASGTVKKANEELTQKYIEWYDQNGIIMYYYGLTDSFEDSSTFVDNTYYIDVDSTGLFDDNTCTALSTVAAICVVYALIVLIRIKSGKYDEQEIEVEIIEDFVDEIDENALVINELVEETEEIEKEHTDEL